MAAHRIVLDADQCCEWGISQQDTLITLPDGFEHFTPAQRQAWVRREIEAIALEVLADIGTVAGRVPTPM
jgi:hypothetical protein